MKEAFKSLTDFSEVYQLRWGDWKRIQIGYTFDTGLIDLFIHRPAAQLETDVAGFGNVMTKLLVTYGETAEKLRAAVDWLAEAAAAPQWQVAHSVTLHITHPAKTGMTIWPASIEYDYTYEGSADFVKRETTELLRTFERKFEPSVTVHWAQPIEQFHNDPEQYDFIPNALRHEIDVGQACPAFAGDARLGYFHLPLPQAAGDKRHRAFAFRWATYHPEEEDTFPIWVRTS